MAEKKYILISMNDEKSKTLAGVLGNKTCKKIIDFLITKNEASEKDIANALNIPINTAEYNLKKLVDSGLIQRAKNFFWSKKGKKIPLYRLSNKSIIISPKSSNIGSKIKTLALVAGISGIAALIIRQFTINSMIREEEILSPSKMFEAASGGGGAQASTAAIHTNFFIAMPVWVWFLIGALFAIVIFTLINWKKTDERR